MNSKMYVIQNLKCGGCSNQITSKLQDIKGVSNIQVNVESSTVYFDYDKETNLEEVATTLQGMGYPLADDQNTLLYKTKSYVSCIIGRVKVAAQNN